MTALRSIGDVGRRCLHGLRSLIPPGTDAPSEQPAQTDHSGLFVAVVPARLALAPRRELRAGVSDEAHGRVREVAMSWQQVATHATFWEMATHDADEGHAYALAGQMAAAGEQLALAYAGGVEVALWQENPDPDGVEVAREMGMRATAEAQSLFVIGTGHALVNVAVLALSLRQDLRAQLIATFFHGKVSVTFDPFSSLRFDWLSMNKPTCEKLRKIAEFSNSEEIVDLIEPVVQLERLGHQVTLQPLPEAA
jgi:hypothetical protein